MNVQLDAMINQFIYFPEREVITTPKEIGLSYEDVHIQASDGTKLHGWLIGDPTFKRTVLFFHGNAGNISHRLDRLRSFGECPARFFFLDYRGYGKSEGTPNEEGLYLDAKAGYEFLLKKGVDTQDIVVFGESLGGAVAIELASTHSIGGAILESTFTSLSELAQQVYPFVPSSMVPNQYDSIGKINRIEAPLLIIHSTQDEIVPFSMGERLFKAAKAPKKLVKIEDTGHNDVYLTKNPEYRTKLLELLVKGCAT